MRWGFRIWHKAEDFGSAASSAAMKGSRHNAPSRSRPKGAGGQSATFGPLWPRWCAVGAGHVKASGGGAAVGSAPPRPSPPGRKARGQCPRRRSVGGHQVAIVRTSAGGLGPCGPAGHGAARICRTATGSSTVAITRSRPPQRGHANTSIANARRINAAHVQLRGRPGPRAPVWPGLIYGSPNAVRCVVGVVRLRGRARRALGTMGALGVRRPIGSLQPNQPDRADVGSGAGASRRRPPDEAVRASPPSASVCGRSRARARTRARRGARPR
jgi:hypothetical protein